MRRMCLNAVVLNDSLILYFLLYVIFYLFFLYLISESFNVSCLFILSVLFCYGLFIYCSSVLCSLNQGIAAKEPCDDDDNNTKYNCSCKRRRYGVVLMPTC